MNIQGREVEHDTDESAKRLFDHYLVDAKFFDEMFS